MAEQYIYVMKGLSKAYAGGKKVLEDVWLSFLPGAKIGVLGPNGAGKSTVMKIMAGLDKEFAGEAWSADGTGGVMPIVCPAAFWTRPITVGPSRCCAMSHAC